MLISVAKAKSYYGYAHGHIYGCDLLGPGTLKSALSREKIDELLHVAVIVPIKCRIKTKISSRGKVFLCFIDYKTTLHFLVRNTLTSNTRLIFDSWNNQFLVLKGVKRKINLIDGSFVE